MEERTETPPKRRSWVWKLVLWLLLIPMVLVALIPVLLYIPVVQDWVCQAIVTVLNTTSEEWTYEVGQVRLAWPLQLKVKDVSVRQRSDDRTLLHVGLLQTGLDDIPLQQEYFVLNKLTVRDVVVGMDSLTESLGLMGTLQGLEVHRIEVDPDNSYLHIREVSVSQPDLLVYLGPSEPDSTSEDSDWQIAVNRLSVDDGSVSVDMSDESLADALASISLTPYLDYQHLSLADVELEVEDVNYRTSHIHAQINHLRGTEQNSGLTVDQLTTSFQMDGDHITVQDLDLQLAPADYLRGNVAIDLTVLDSVPRGVADVLLDAAIDSLNLIRLAAPYLPSLADNWSNGQSRLKVNARLEDQTLDLRHLALKVPGMADLTAEGSGSQLLNDKERQAAVTLRGDVQRGDRLLSALVALPTERDYRLPDDLTLTAEAAQRGDRLAGNVELLQNQQLVAQADVTYDMETEAYSVTADVCGLNVSDYLPSLAYDGIRARVHADGRHFKLPGRSTRLEAELQVDTLYYPAADGRRDSLLDAHVRASLLAGRYQASLHAAMPVLRIDSRLSGCYLKDTVSAQGYLDLHHADLGHLPYIAPIEDLGVLALSSRIDAAYNWGDIAHLSLQVDSLIYQDEQQRHCFDSIVVALDSRPGALDAHVHGGDALLNLQMDQSVAHLSDALDTLMTEVNRQLAAYRPDFETLQQRLPQVSLDFQMAHDNPFYGPLTYRTGYSFDRAEMLVDNGRWLDIRGVVTNLQNEDASLDLDTLSLVMHPAGIDDNYLLAVHALHVDPRASKTYDVHASAELLKDSIPLSFRYVNGKYLTVYDVGASLAFGDDTLTLHLEKNPTLYEQPFTVNPDNFISLMKYKDMAHVKPETRARLLMDGPQDLKVNLYTRKMPKVEVGNQMLLLVRNLDLAYATRLMEWDGDIGGRYNLMASVDLFPDSLAAHLRSGARGFHLGDFRADTLSFVGDGVVAHNVRDLTGELTVDSIVRMQLDAALADGVDARVSINELPLALAGTFLPRDMQLYGNASGGLTVKGPDMDHARINASLAMQQAGMNITDMDAHLQFAPDTLRLTDNCLRLQDYHILADNKNPIVLGGKIDLSRDLANPTIDLQIKGDNVRLIKNKKLRLKDQYIYGNLPVTTNIRVGGTLAKMDVTGRLNVLSGTDIHYFMQDDPLATSSRVDQLVEFVSFREVDRLIGSGKIRRRRVQQNADEGLNVKLKIEVASDALVSAHLAGVDKNRVDITGSASLTLECDQEGRMVMSGDYDVRGGMVDYKLPILPMVKTFKLDPSSRLSWPGSDPANPDIDLTAIEEVRSTVSDEAGSRVVRFLVNIHISGTLEALNLTFDCSAPDDANIATELSTLDDDERSKAALMLLIAQTYIGPGNNSSVGLGTANAALSSMLNRQMDSMLGNNMKHTNIDVGIDTYNTETGNVRTNYSVKVSQNFFNDRFRATIGGQVTSDYDDGRTSGLQLGDMSLEWLIKRDGSHYLKLFRTTNYESIIEGELIETGISYVQERSGYRWRQLLIPTSRKRQQQVQEMLQKLIEKEE